MNTKKIKTCCTTIAALILASTIILTTGCAQDINQLRTQGIDQFRDRQYVQSMASLRHVLELYSNDARANHYMGLNYRAMAVQKFRQDNLPAACRELDTAIIYFTRAIKTWPNYMEAVACKNEALEARGKYQAALELAEKVAQSNRGISEHYVYLGNEYRERGDYDNAIKSYKIALASNPNSANAYVSIGKLFLKINDKASALEAFRKAYQLNPNDQSTTSTNSNPNYRPATSP